MYPRIFNCPSNIITTVEPGKTGTTVTWEEPFAVNLSPSAKISSTHRSNETFPVGSTKVVYTFEDTDDGIKKFCNFTVVVTRYGNSFLLLVKILKFTDLVINVFGCDFFLFTIKAFLLILIIFLIRSNLCKLIKYFCIS